MTAGPLNDGFVYFTTTNGGVAKKNTATGGGLDGTTNIGSSAYGITVGPDNNLWVASGGPGAPGQVSKLSTAPALLQSFLLPANAQPHGIVTGPDGALWVAESGTDSVARVTTSGEVTQVPLSGCSHPEDIAVGADKALWVTCFGVAAGPANVPPAVPGKALVRIVPDAAAPGPGPGPGPGPVTPPVANLKGGFSFQKGKVFAGKVFTVNVSFNKAVTKSRVRVQIKSVNTKRTGAIKSFQTISTKLVTGKKAALKVKIAKPGAFLMRITAKNGTKTLTLKAVKITVKPKPIRQR